MDAARRFEEAIAEYQKAIATRPDYADAHINLGMVLWELGRQEGAIPQFQKVFANAIWTILSCASTCENTGSEISTLMT